MTKKFFEERRPHNGMTYGEFSNKTKSYVEQVDESLLNEKEKLTLKIW